MNGQTIPVKRMKTSIQRLLAAFEDEQEIRFINRSGITVRDTGDGRFQVCAPLLKTGGWISMHHINKAAATIMAGLGMRHGDTDPALAIFDGRTWVCILGSLR